MARLFRLALIPSVSAVTAASAMALAASAAPSLTSRVSAHDASPPLPVVIAAPAPVRAAPVVTHKPTPKPTPKPTHKAAPKPRATHRATPTATHHATTSSLPFDQRMMQAVARIPGYRTGDAMWIVRKQSNWGLALMGGGTVYISPTVPSDKLYDVVVHEWSHLLSVRDYGNDVDAATSAMNAYFGGSGLTGSERAADCMAKVLGAVWTHYTPCTNSAWRAGARKLVAGQRL